MFTWPAQFCPNSRADPVPFTKRRKPLPASSSRMLKKIKKKDKER